MTNTAFSDLLSTNDDWSCCRTDGETTQEDLLIDEEELPYYL